MLNTLNASIDKLIIHRVGNKVRDEKYTKSESLLEVGDDINQILLNYFLQPFLGKDEIFQFTHTADLALNEIFIYCSNIFANNENFISESYNILTHLYEQSVHPKISEGDLFVVLFKGIKFEEKSTEVIGIFKAERKDTFLKTALTKKNILLNAESGINTKQLDKGCLIVNSDKRNGYKILTIDNNGYDAQYWMDNFLKVININSSNLSTRNYLKLCQDFGKEFIEPKFDKTEKIVFMQKSLDYFNKNEKFDLDNFAKNVMPDKAITKEFKNFTANFQRENGLSELDEFEISHAAVKTMKRLFKNFIALDTNIELKLNFKNPESESKFVEKGYDNEKQMYFYKIYFNEEIN